MLLSRRHWWRLERADVTFDGVSIGAVGNIVIGTVTGAIIVEYLVFQVKTALTIGAGATLAVNMSGGAIVAATNASGFDTAGKIWGTAVAPNTGAEVDAGAPHKRGILGDSGTAQLRLVVGTNTVNTGVLRVFLMWRPGTYDGAFTLNEPTWVRA